MKKVIIPTLVIALIAAMSLTQSCSKSSSTPPAPTPTTTLYDSLGGTAMVQDPNAPTGTMIEQGYLTIRSVVDSAIFVIAADNNINSYFTVLLTEVGAGNLSGYEALSNNLTTFFAVGTGAKDYTYGGKSMHDAHDPTLNSRIPAQVGNDDFTSFEGDVVAGAGQNGVPSTSPIVASLGRIMESLRTSVVSQ
jgi:hypothetical protein